MDLPFRAEYAKSGRSTCKTCQRPISQEELRIAVMVQSRHHDGRDPRWNHFKCFFQKSRPKTTADIENFESLRIEDQNRISEQINTSVDVIVPTKKGKKRSANEAAAVKAAFKDYLIQYSVSARAVCRGCELKIQKNEIRISKKDYDSEIGRKFGGQDVWHHLECFAKLRSEMGYFESADKLPGFKALSKEDQAKAKKLLPAIKQEETDAKKIKTEDEVDNKKLDKKYAEQIKLLYKFRDALKENFKKQDLAEMLIYNKQNPKSGLENLLDQLADVMTFGALKKCPECKKGQLYFTKFGYECSGDLTEWTKCKNLVLEPERVPFKIPKEYNLDEWPSFIKNYKYKTAVRVIKDVKPTVSVVKDETDAGPKIKRDLPALYEMEFVTIGNLTQNKDKIKEQIAKLGGKLVSSIKPTTMAVISTEKEVEKMNSKMKQAEVEQIHVVPEEFLSQAETNAGKIPELITKLSICTWGGDPKSRLPSQPSSSGGNKSNKSKSIYTKSMPSTQKFKIKGGGAVDPASGLEDVAHVYENGKDKYTATLGITDVQANKNSYYKLQLLQSDTGNRYWLFRAWGRIGTIIGGDKTEPFDSLHEAKNAFCDLYLEKSGNLWENHHNFQKVPGRMYPIDIDYGDDDDNVNMDIVESKSELPKPVQELIRLIFDVKKMQNLMKEYELDMEKMPLGKLSKKQIQKAYQVLTELQELIESGGNQSRFIDATNRFYTLIPHSFGVDNVPIITDPELIKTKIEMLDSLMELEVAYNLMRSSGNDHTVDSYYKQLNTEIGMLERDSKEFKIINDYVRNTHAATHSSYTLEIEEIYTVKRSGEEKRYKPFKKLKNRKLLWHGSRLTNFAGILSQGLRIAPPEAPVTGYMFGKGIYFADMVSKSANYCCTSPQQPTGLLLLCEVALGNMYERLQADCIEKLPKGKNSTKGVGRTQPDPTASEFIDGVEVPIGKGTEIKDVKSSLLYNEYIVYDVAQVNVKYLLKVNFKYKY